MKNKFIFYSKPADKTPGKGKGEYVEEQSLYNNLANIPDWRKNPSGLTHK